MPELCGSTTLSASKVAKAASAAVPPWRSISTPAAAARGSAALTMPVAAPTCGAAARAGLVVQAASERAAARWGRRLNIGERLLAPDRLGNVGEAVAGGDAAQAVSDAPGNSGPAIDHRAIQLDQAGAGADTLPRVLGGRDAAG